MTPRPPSRPKENLSRVYLDDYPITLMGDEATPPLSRIIRAGGKKPDRVDVIYLTSPADRKGRAVDPETIIDRTAEPTRPIYLRTLPKAKPVLTADRPETALSGPDPSVPLTSRAPMANVDPVIAQLGGVATRVENDAAEVLAALRAIALARAARLAEAGSAQATAEDGADPVPDPEGDAKTRN